MVTSSCPRSFGHYFSTILEVSLGRGPWGLVIFDTIIDACGITVQVSRPLDSLVAKLYDRDRKWM